jgi:hypothetical protein
VRNIVSERSIDHVATAPGKAAGDVDEDIEAADFF